MRAVVTGAAGFIGSTLAERLVADGHRVTGVDCFTGYYSREQKEQNLARLRTSGMFDLRTIDLRTDDLSGLLDGVDVVFHQAGQPGVRHSWSTGFDDYLTHNVLATQRLLEASAGAGLSRFVYASSSSVYGNSPRYPTAETDLPLPHSPYGVTKLAGEHLCGLYAGSHGVPTIALRYFTVFGPRQRPDMAIYRMIEAALNQTPFRLYGDGEQIRDFTFVDDVVDANLAAAAASTDPGAVVNVSGGASVSMNRLIEIVGELAGKAVPVEKEDAKLGDVKRTGGAVDLSRQVLGWSPRHNIEAGLEAQIAWHRGRQA
jgi:UDP-glucuronate 4-epimerase